MLLDALTADALPIATVACGFLCYSQATVVQHVNEGPEEDSELRLLCVYVEEKFYLSCQSHPR